MKNRKVVILILTLIFCSSIGFCACTSTSNNSPYDVIKDAYGDESFKISFNSEEMDNPISDIYYTANSIPTLPTPSRVGYIFEGWYLDSEFAIPYIDGILYLYMCDVTMYAKWSKISFDVNGTYDLEFNAKILEDTIIKSDKTDIYGGYADFSQAIIAEETYLEKSDNKLLLRLQFNCEITTPFLTTIPSWVYNVGVSSMMPTSIRVDSKIDALNNPVKTVFIDITDFDLSQTLYLDIQTINWEYPNLTDAERAQTLTRYTVAFDITRIIGFSEIYADYTSKLEEGYYLAKSYYSYPDGSDGMGVSFNPVYSYIYSDGNNNYKLIKQNIPYAGLMSGTIQLEPYYLYYFQRMMVFLPIQTAYRVDMSDYNPDKEYVYLPEAYNASKYITTSIEFHAEEGKAYNIFELGNDLTSSLMLTTAVTGYMEVADAMGSYEQLLTIDYEHLIKLSSCDYKALEGDAYQYQSEMQYYPGNLIDLNEKNLTYQSIIDNGISTHLINYYYSAESLTSADSTKTIYDSKITITPSASANAQNISDSRYSIANFSINTLVFGYDQSTDNNLYADSMTIQTFGSSGWRESFQIKSGKICYIGEQINLSDLFNEKVDSYKDFADVDYKIYKIKDGNIDYSSQISIDSPVLQFAEDIAVIFETQNNGYVYKNIVELVLYKEPEITLIPLGDSPYNSEESYMAGMTISFPDLEYSWMGNSGNFIDYYYSTDELNINTMYSASFMFDGEKYVLDYNGRTTKELQLSGDKTLLIYQLKNIYGEHYFYIIEIDTSQKLTYSIEDTTGNILQEGNIQLDSNGERSRISYVGETEDINLSTAYSQIAKNYYININGRKSDYSPVSYSIYSDVTKEYAVDTQGASIDSIANNILSKINNAKYAIIQIEYIHGTDTIVKSYALNTFVSTNNNTNSLLPYKTYFVNYDYSLPKYNLYSTNGDFISTGNLSISGQSDTSVDYLDYQYNFIFNESGEYKFTYKFTIGYGINYIKSTKTIVKSQFSDITIKYVTDEDHCFDDGTTSKTLTYNLAEEIFTLSKKECASKIHDKLYGWVLDLDANLSSTLIAGNAILNYVNTFNSDNITLYAVWDPGITITYKAEGEKDITRTVYLSSFYKGNYNIELMDYSDRAPSNKQFAGWTGGFLGNEICEVTPLGYRLSMSNVEWNNSDFFVIEAVFLEVYTVKYSIDSNFSDDFYRSESVLEGYGVNAPIIKNNISCKIEGYEFKGWYVQGDETHQLIDLELYKIYDNITLVALFGKIGE